MDPYWLIVLIVLGGVAALVAFAMSRKSGELFVTLVSAVSGTAISVVVGVMATIAINRSLELELSTILDLTRAILPGAVTGAALGVWWASRYRREA